jgi:hypothetical protein
MTRKEYACWNGEFGGELPHVFGVCGNEVGQRGEVAAHSKHCTPSSF